MFVTRVKWEVARDYCLTLETPSPARLAVPNSEVDLRDMSNIFKKSDAPDYFFWSGINLHNGDWVDDSTGQNTSSDFYLDDTGIYGSYYRRISEGRDCVLFSEEPYDFSWMILNGDEFKFSFMCEYNV